MRYAILLCVLLSWTASFGQKEAYVLYNAKGKKVSYAKMLKEIQKQDVVLFGETHNNPIAHWLQLEVTKDLHEVRELILGAEMIEADNQLPLTAYVTGEIEQKALDTLARLWPNYRTDYAPLVNFAKANKLHFVGTNIPRRYARLVHKNGFGGLDPLTAQEKSWIAPLPIPFDIELPTYQKILEMMSGSGHGGEQLVMAQATKDATMAHFILANYQPGKLFLHYNGSFHSDFYEGILWYLKKNKADLNYGTISTVSQADISKLEKEHLNKADFIICVDEDMTTTY